MQIKKAPRFNQQTYKYGKISLQRKCKSSLEEWSIQNTYCAHLSLYNAWDLNHKHQSSICLNIICCLFTDTIQRYSENIVTIRLYNQTCTELSDDLWSELYRNTNEVPRPNTTHTQCPHSKQLNNCVASLPSKTMTQGEAFTLCGHVVEFIRPRKFSVLVYLPASQTLRGQVIWSSKLAPLQLKVLAGKIWSEKKNTQIFRDRKGLSQYRYVASKLQVPSHDLSPSPDLRPHLCYLLNLNKT